MKYIYVLLVVLVFKLNTSYSQTQEIIVPCESALDNENVKQVYPTINSHLGAGPVALGPENPKVNVITPLPPPLPGSSDERLISWVHGLSGGDGTWEIASEEIELTFKTIQDRPFYLQPTWEESKANLLQDAREGSLKAVNDHNLEPRESFVIAHSLGGLMSRAIQQDLETNPIPQDENPFNGLITVGTPHLGAAIVDNFDGIGNYVLDGIEKVSVAYVYQTYQNSFAGKSIVEGLISHFTDVDLDDPWAIIGSVTNLSNPAFFSKIWDSIISMKDPGVAKALSPDSDYIAGLQAYQNDNPSIAMFGIEDDPALLRFISDDPNSEQPWRNNEDDHWVLEMDTVAMELYEEYVYYNTLYLDYEDESCNFISWVLFTTPCLIFELQEAWENWDQGNLFLGSRFFSAAHAWVYNLDDMWKLYTGAAVMQEELNYYACHCEILDNSGNVVDNAYFQVENAIDCVVGTSDENCTASPVINYYFEQIDEYDGVVVANSGMAFPNVGVIRKLDSSNHNQMKNNNQFKIELFDSFIGEDLSFFKTQMR